MFLGMESMHELTHHTTIHTMYIAIATDSKMKAAGYVYIACYIATRKILKIFLQLNHMCIQ